MSLPDSVAPATHRARAPVWPLAVACVLIALGFAGLLLASAHALDIRILLAMRNPADPAQLSGPHWLQEMLRDFMGLGGEGVIILFIAGGLGILWLAARRRDAIWLLVVVIGAFVIGSVLKHVIGRPRPDVIPHAAYTFTNSFPSGHTLMATVVWVSLALLLAAAIGRRAVRNFTLLGALVIAFAVGASRIYMGVHWPSDVVESWGIGLAWVWLAWWVRSRGVSGRR